MDDEKTPLLKDEKKTHYRFFTNLMYYKRTKKSI